MRYKLWLVFVLLIGLIGCSSNQGESNVSNSTENMNLIYEETISPNEEFAENEEDVVIYNIEIYQDEDKNILVDATSNSEFFKSLQQRVECDKLISKSDIVIEWTTLMGNTVPKSDDQFVIAHISFLEDEKEWCGVKINFLNGGVEMILSED